MGAVRSMHLPCTISGVLYASICTDKRVFLIGTAKMYTYGFGNLSENHGVQIKVEISQFEGQCH